MQSILTEPVASTLLVLDAMDGATLTEIARTTGRPLSTIQRAVNGLVDANVVVRETPRGRLRFAPEAPRHALRELAEWRLGKKDADRIALAARVAPPASSWPSAPTTIRDEVIRAAWPTAIQSIVSVYHPARVVLFGSQARGDAGPNSDVDLLVICRFRGKRRELMVEMTRALIELDYAFDVVILRPEELERDRDIPGTIGRYAYKEGKIVYEQS